MADVVLIGHAPSRTMYEEVNKRMGDDSSPPGLIVHTAAEDTDGTVRIVDVWESREAADAFERDRLMPAVDALMADSPADAPPDGRDVEYLETFHVIRN